MKFQASKTVFITLLLILCETVSAQDSTYQMVAMRRNRTFVFAINSQISVIQSNVEYYGNKTKGRITDITDSTITIYSLIKNKSTVVPIKNIIRFSRANNSLLRYIAFITLGSIVTLAGIEASGFGSGNNSSGTKSNGSIQAFEVAAVAGLVFSYSAVYPSLVGEICKKHFIQYGWRLHTEKIKKVPTSYLYLR